MELDVLALVYFLHNSVENKALEPSLSNCRTLLTEFQNRRVMHTYLEGKKCVDVLAKLGSSLSCNLVVFDSLLFVVNWRLLSLDAEGNASNRLILFLKTN